MDTWKVNLYFVVLYSNSEGLSELPYGNDFPWVCPYEPAAVDSGRIFRRPAWACDYTTWCSNLFWSLSTSWKKPKQS